MVCKCRGKDGECNLVEDSSVQGMCVDGPCPYEKPLTNADHIRAMTDEELANLMMHFSDYVPEPNGGTPEQCWLDWLKQEAEE